MPCAILRAKIRTINRPKWMEPEDGKEKLILAVWIQRAIMRKAINRFGNDQSEL